MFLFQLNLSINTTIIPTKKVFTLIKVPMKKYLKAVPLSLFATLLSIFASLPASASIQTESLALQIVPTSSPLTELLTAAGEYTYLEPLSTTQTQITPENEGHWYGWTFDPYASLPCAQATPLTAQIRVLNSLQSEGNPDWSVIVLASTDGSTVAPIEPERPLIEGFSPGSTPYAGRWSIGAEDFPPATTEWAIGITGAIEAVWNISSLTPSNQLVIGSGHDAEDGTTGLQTTVESVEVTYDTTQCASTNPSSPAVTTPPTSPKTGLVVNLIVWSSILISSLALLFVAAKRLKKTH